MSKVQLVNIGLARCGDKGDILNVALFAPDRHWYDVFVREVTIERVRELYSEFVHGKVERYEAPNVLALNFVMHRALDGGAANSLRADSLGKALGSLILRLWIETDV